VSWRPRGRASLPSSSPFQLRPSRCAAGCASAALPSATVSVAASARSAARSEPTAPRGAAPRARARRGCRGGASCRLPAAAALAQLAVIMAAVYGPQVASAMAGGAGAARAAESRSRVRLGAGDRPGHSRVVLAVALANNEMSAARKMKAHDYLMKVVWDISGMLLMCLKIKGLRSERNAPPVRKKLRVSLEAFLLRRTFREHSRPPRASASANCS
jgi:hypothetical protein